MASIDDLPREQLLALAKIVGRHWRHYNKLRDRTFALNFPIADPLKLAIKQARDGVYDLRKLIQQRLNPERPGIDSAPRHGRA